MRGFWMLLFVFYKFWVVKSEELASFFGNSYISVPLQEAYASNDIQFSFRTWLPDALFLLVAGRTDFCIVQLEAGLLKLRINLGAGEEEILSPNDVKLNDGDWHQVKIIRKEANLTLEIDKIHIVRTKLPGQFFELNIQFGVYVGGDGHFKEQFLGHLIGLRGCMSNLLYGGVNLLQHARQRQGSSKIHGITWNCASEFDSTVNTELSFVEDNAYVLLLHSTGRAGARWNFDIKTTLNNSVLLYNNGVSSSGHTIAIEINSGHITMMFNNKKIYKIVNNVFISDNSWHKVIALYNPYQLELTVDTTMETTKIMATKYLDLSESFYVGGLELTKRTRALVKGVNTAEMNFIGCLKGLAVNGEPLGLSNAVSTFGIKSNICLSDKQTNKSAIELEIISTQPVIVNEGKSAQIGPTNIHLIVDYPRWGLRENMIHFYVLGLQHGKFQINSTSGSLDSKKFTLVDLSTGKVEYLHDGSETLKDTVLLEVKLTDLATLPNYLQQSYKFNLTVNVIPQNDPPIIIAPGLLRMAKGTRKIITNEVLNVTDVDTDSSKLAYYVVKSYKYSKTGQIEYIDKPNKSITTFTQKDIDENRVIFACTIDCNTKPNESISEIIILNVTDGKSAFQTLALKILLYDLELTIKYNKGIYAVHNSTSLIQSKDLSFTSNIIDEIVLNNIRIDVVEPPDYGMLECRRDDKFWNTCDWFFMSDVNQKHVRYKHTTGVPEIDNFKFRASINKISTTTLYNFSITFIQLKLEQLHLTTVLLNGTYKSPITIDHIQYQTIPILAANKNIKFIITNIPMYGDVVVLNSEQNKLQFSGETKQNDDQIKFGDHSKLQNGDSFTQMDIERENLVYFLHLPTYSNLTDSLKFLVSSKNCENVFGSLKIQYVPSDQLKSQLKSTIQSVQVIEGEKSNIPTSHLNIEIQGISKFNYNITNPSKHGNIQKCLNKRCSDEKYCLRQYECFNVTEFTTDQLNDGSIFYSHDNSETRHDYFEFQALSSGVNNFQYIGNFTIDVILKNDNSPKRTVDKVVQVVQEQTKLITGDDLKYVDADINTTPNDIIYTCQSISNGFLFNVLRPNEKITTFTQADLDNRLILFKHHGDEYGKISLWITDGQFYENGELEILASKPFIKIVTSTQLICKRESSVVVTEKYLSVETNLNVAGKNIVYRILKHPKYGYLKFNLNLDTVRFFNYDDLIAGHIVYFHNKSSEISSEDQFIVRVTSEGTYSEAKIKIRILPAIYWQPLSISSITEPLYVEESTSAVITRKWLEVSHTEILSNEIIYHIKTQPKNGYLQLKSKNNQEKLPLTTFDQYSINQNQLQYIQNVANKISDQIVFDVTNGINWLRNLILNISIIPEHFYLKTVEVNVSEGGSVVITKNEIQIATDYYKNKIFQYSLTRMPNYGSIQIGRSREFIQKFSERDLIKGLVKYVHDNSENFNDYFEIIAHSGYKESEPAGINIKIAPINDQTPTLINNTGLKMWEGGCEQITNAHLGAFDGDIPSDSITYRITGNWWGNLVLLKANTTTVLNYFTQKQIEDGLVYFNHTNGTIAKFMFRLTDSIHTSKEYIFTIETKPITVHLKINTGLHVFPFKHQLITNKHLTTYSSDPTRNIVYKIVVPPTCGRIVMEVLQNGGNFYSVDQFSQADIDNRKIYYEHTHPFDGLYANDSFVFNIKGYLFPTISMQKFNIDISVSSGDLNTYIPITPVIVDEGGAAPILLNISQVVQFLENRANLHAPIIHASLWSPPEHGTIYIKDNSNLTTFTQSQLESNIVKYQHDHSDTLNDTIRFTLYLLPDYITLCTVNIPVHINPINDQPFKLITQAPHMSVVYGENATITKDLLLTEDPDTPPQQLEYGVINEPSEGKILLLPDLYPINKFTQKDINDGRVIYKHSGSNTTVSFHFRVWDGKFKPIYTIFNIQIIPVNIFLDTYSPIYIQQGLHVATITLQHIQVKTNVNPNRVMYNITRQPLFGGIYVQDVPIQSFTHSDLVNSRVMYIQTNMSSPNDTFRVSANVQNVAVSNIINVQMLVQPLMQRGNFTAIIGKQNKISLSVLDAASLAELTSSNPKYSVTQKPTFGTLHKIIHSSGDRKIVYDQEVDSFSHEEIRSGVIYYVLPAEQSLNEIDDLLRFSLFGNIFFQPAHGELRIRILSSRIEPELKRHRGGVHLASPNISSDYFPIVMMVVGILLLGVSVIIIIKCRSVDLIKEDPNNLINLNHQQQPIPLPRPPDHLMTSSANLKPLIEEIPLTTHISLPHCKVTPLGPTESSLASSDLDIRSRYPYGSAEDGTIIEDWCSHDAPLSESISQQHQHYQQQSSPLINAANPLLRRNQYWV